MVTYIYMYMKGGGGGGVPFGRSPICASECMTPSGNF